MIRTSLLTALALVVPTLLTNAGCGETPTVLTVQSFTSGSEGFDTSSYWVDTGEEVVVFDAQFTLELAQQLVAEIHAATDSPIRYLVVTHPNPDKFNGATVFQAEGAQVVASVQTAEAMPGVHAYKEAYFTSVGMFEPGDYPPLPTVDLTFEDRLSLDLNGKGSVELVVLDEPGVSSTQTVALLEGAVITGDLLANQAHAWLEGGIVDGAPVPTLEGWQLALDQVLEEVPGDALVYPGRGGVQPVSEAVPAQQAYLSTLDTLVADYVAGLDNPTAALTGSEAGSHYAALTAAAEAAFPSYTLSYLVTYGVYGLALQHAADIEAAQ